MYSKSPCFEGVFSMVIQWHIHSCVSHPVSSTVILFRPVTLSEIHPKNCSSCVMLYLFILLLAINFTKKSVSCCFVLFFPVATRFSTKFMGYLHLNS